jgi:hypothetical protein
VLSGLLHGIELSPLLLLLLYPLLVLSECQQPDLYTDDVRYVNSSVDVRKAVKRNRIG